MKKLLPIRILKKRAEAVFHKWIVKRDKGICFTCGRPGTHAGHYRHGKLDFDEDNLRCQCMYCNTWLHGNLGIYTLNLINLYGKEWVDQLVLRSNTTLNKFSREELENFIKKYS